jgi:hypothetical protein
VRQVNLDTHPRPVSSKPTRTARRTQASHITQHRTGECNVWHDNLDDLQHADCRKPLQPARHARTSAQRPDRVGKYNVQQVNLDAQRR